MCYMNTFFTGMDTVPFLTIALNFSIVIRFWHIAWFTGKRASCSFIECGSIVDMVIIITSHRSLLYYRFSLAWSLRNLALEFMVPDILLADSSTVVQWGKIFCRARIYPTLCPLIVMLYIVWNKFNNWRINVQVTIIDFCSWWTNYLRFWTWTRICVNCVTWSWCARKFGVSKCSCDPCMVVAH